MLDAANNQCKVKLVERNLVKHGKFI
jgi:hypothetical protein